MIIITGSFLSLARTSLVLTIAEKRAKWAPFRLSKLYHLVPVETVKNGESGTHLDYQKQAFS